MPCSGTCGRAKTSDWIVREKKYTEDHEWIELSEDGKTGMALPPRHSTPFSSAALLPCASRPYPHHPLKTTPPPQSLPSLSPTDPPTPRNHRHHHLRREATRRRRLRRAAHPLPRSKRRRHDRRGRIRKIGFGHHDARVGKNHRGEQRAGGEAGDDQ